MIQGIASLKDAKITIIFPLFLLELIKSLKRSVKR